jgi:putative redox protein
VISIGAPSDPSHVEHHDDARLGRALANGDAEWLVGRRALTLKRGFVEYVSGAAA